MDEEIKDILSNYIIKGIDPYFSRECRSNLRYAAREYIYAVLMEPNPKGVDILDYLYFAKADLLYQWATWAQMRIHSPKDYRQFLVMAGYSDIEVHEVIEKNWIAVTGKKAHKNSFIASARLVIPDLK